MKKGRIQLSIYHIEKEIESLEEHHETIRYYGESYEYYFIALRRVKQKIQDLIELKYFLEQTSYE